jgi:hypothetical protein
MTLALNQFIIFFEDREPSYFCPLAGTKKYLQARYPLCSFDYLLVMRK